MIRWLRLVSSLRLHLSSLRLGSFMRFHLVLWSGGISAYLLISFCLFPLGNITITSFSRGESLGFGWRGAIQVGFAISDTEFVCLNFGLTVSDVFLEDLFPCSQIIFLGRVS